MEALAAEILVLGAGMAGLTAARSLAEAGLNVTVLEARDRLGGRIFTARDGPHVVEMGAEFVHGKPPELWNLIAEAKLETYEYEGTDACFRNGKLQNCDEENEHSTDLLDDLEDVGSADMSFADYLDRKSIPDSQRHRIVNYVEGFNAADQHIISTASLGIQQAAEREISGDRMFRIRSGYDALPEFLARKFREAGGVIRLNTQVERITWSRGRVQVEAGSKAGPVHFESRRAVIALPLGVLQTSVEFAPEPQQITEAKRMRMGEACRFTLLFRERFWHQHGPSILSGLSFLFSEETMPPVWWTAHPATEPVITGWAGGPRSRQLAQIPLEELGNFACDALATVFSMSPDYVRNRLVRCFSHDWQQDPFSRGAYSYVPAGAVDAPQNMAHAALETLYFAGEHTDTTGHWGTVHAAMRTGFRAARQIADRPT